MTTNSQLDSRLASLAREHGDRFDRSGLAPQFDAYYRGKRIRVQTVYGTGAGPDGETHVRTGVVGMTTGWRPAYLLIRRSSDHGSSDVLGERDRIIAVQDRPGGPYRAL